MSRRIVFIFLFLTTIFFFDACKKPGPANVVITVINDTNVVVSNATIRIYSKPSDSTVDISKKSDASGQASFEFDTDYVLNIHCEKEINGNQVSGDGVVEIHVNATAEKTITLK